MTGRRNPNRHPRSPTPPSSDSYDEFDDGYVLINGNVREVRWDGDQSRYARRTPTIYQAAVMTAKETWENPSGATVQQVVGSAASELTAKASGLKTAAAAHVNMERVQHYVGTGAWKLANVVSKVAYHAASKVSSMTLPVDAGNAEDGITVTRQDIGPGMSMMVVQQAQNADDIREPLLNGFRMEGMKAERDDEERKNLLDEFLETIGPDTDVGCRHSTAQVHSDQKHHATTIKMLGSLHEDEELLRKRRLRQYGLGVRIPMNDDLTNPAYGNNIQDPKQVQHGGSLRAESYSKNEPGPRFTEDEGPYDNLGVSNVWNNPRKKLVSEEEKKALAQRWQSQEDRSARDRGSRKVDAKKDAQPSYIPVRVTRGPRAIDSADKEEEVKQAPRDLPSKRSYKKIVSLDASAAMNGSLANGNDSSYLCGVCTETRKLS